MFAIFSSAIGLISDFPTALYGLFSGLILLIISLVYFRKYLTWNLGAKGEETVIDELKKLGKNFHIVHDVRLPNIKGNIDHIVIGENGIFVIETKHHRGDIKYENGMWTQEKISLKGKSYLGDFTDPIKQANRNAVKLRQFISEQEIFSEKFRPWINTIIVFTNSEVNLQIEKAPTDIIRVGDLCRTIQNKKTKIKLSKNEVDELFDILQKIVISERKTSSFEGVGESYWLKNYLSYARFGFIWGIFYAIIVTLVAQQFNFIDYWMFGILFNGIILFILGKSLIDLFMIKVKNDILRLSLVHFISYLPIFLFTGFFFTTVPISEYPIENIAELAIRLGIVVLTVVIYKMLGWKMPS